MVKKQSELTVKKEVKAAQSLIHIRHSISITQYKYWLLFLKSYKDDLDAGKPIELDDEGFYLIPISRLSKMLGYEVSKKLLKNDLDTLRKEGVIINYLEKDGIPATKGAGFISEWKVKGTKVGVLLPTFLLNVLKGDKDAKEMFLRLNWDIFNSFSGKYEAIIYKLCMDYMGLERKLGFGRTPDLSIDEYRNYIGLNDDEYPQFKELNRCTISRPVSNINKNELSEILIESHFVKQGRRVIAVYFTARYKRGRRPAITFENVTEDILDTRSSESPAFADLRISLSARRIQEYLSRYDENEIKSIVSKANQYLDKQQQKGIVVKNIAGVYYKALDEGWDKDSIKQKLAEESQKALLREQKEAEKRARKLKEEKNKKDEELKRLERERCIFEFEKLSELEQSNIVNSILQNIPKSQHKLYRPEGVVDFYKSPPMVFEIVKFIKNHQ